MSEHCSFLFIYFHFPFSALGLIYSHLNIVYPIHLSPSTQFLQLFVTFSIGTLLNNLRRLLELLWEANNIIAGLSQAGNNQLVLATLIHNGSLSDISLNIYLGTTSQVVLKESDLLVVKNRDVVPISDSSLTLVSRLRRVSVDSQRVGEKWHTILGFSRGDIADGAEQLHFGKLRSEGR